MSFTNLFLQNIVDRKLNYIELKLLEQILPSNLSTRSKEYIAILLKNNPKISPKIADLEGKIYDQIEIGTLMFINGLIGLIPIPVIPGLIRDLNNILFQFLQTADTIFEFKQIIDTSVELLHEDPTIISFLENKGINIEKINPNVDKNKILENVANSAKKEFDKIDEEYLYNGKLTPSQIYDRITTLAAEKDRIQNTAKKEIDKIDEEYLYNGKLTPSQIYDRINTLAAERDRIQNTKKPISLPSLKNSSKPLTLPSPKNSTKPLTLPSPKNSIKSLTLPRAKSSKITQKAGKKIKNKKQKKYYKKITRRNKHKK